MMNKWAPGTPKWLVPLVFLLLLGASLILLQSTPSWAAGAHNAAAAAQSSGGGPTPDNLQQRITVLLKQPQSEARDNELALLRQAQQFLEQARASAALTAQLAQQAKEAPRQLRAIERQLARPLPQPQQINVEKISLDKLVQQQQAAKAKLDKEQQQSAEVEQQASTRAERRQSIPAESISARKRLEQINQKLQGLSTSAQASSLDNAARYALLAEQQFLRQKLLQLDEETRSYDAQRDLLRAQRQLATRNVLVAERQLGLLDAAVSAMRLQAAEITRHKAEVQRLNAASASAAIKGIAEQNERLAAEHAEISDKGNRARALKQQIDQQLDQVNKSYDTMREKITRAGLSDAIGLRLRTLRFELPDTHHHLRAIRQRSEEMNAIQLRRIELEDDLLALVDIPGKARQLAKKNPQLSTKAQARLLNRIQQALKEQRDHYLRPLIKAYDVYFDDLLMPLDEYERQLVNLVNGFRSYIDQRILWVQSTHPLSARDLTDAWQATAWLLDPTAWLKLLEQATGSLRMRALPFGLALLPVIILAWQNKKLLRLLSETGQQAKRKFRARFHHTLLAIVLTLLVAGNWPFLLWIISWQLGHIADSSFASAVSAGLDRLALLLFVGRLLLVIVRNNGLAAAHFGWAAASIALIRKQISWLLPVILPLVYVIAALELQPFESHRDSLARLAFIALMGIISYVLIRLFRPHSGQAELALHSRRELWRGKLKSGWFLLLLLIPLSLIIMAIMGFFYTAIQLEQDFFKSALFILVTVLLKDTIMRWLELSRRKLAIEQARKKQAVLIKAREEAVDSHTATAATADILPDETLIDVTAISDQTRKLVKGLFASALIVGLILIWRDVLPAFSFLTEIKLWEHFVATTAATASTQGQSIQQLVPVSLADLLTALLTLIITFLVSKNLPGLLEIAVLQYLPFAPGGRYAITTLVRYSVVLLGLLYAFDTIGIGWNQVQWLAAAITVGLGFGLQEIFANFVSGLIILFERPIRVGDTVTVGEIIGKVTRIQMRATTITGWDRKELIIPNKEFVTGQIINWSLSDKILRLSIQVGIAYGSDTVLATRLLYDIARRHPAVLDEPQPAVSFKNFGDSTLDFELRVFIADPDEMFNINHDLHMAIDRSFRDHDIEIAFPQRDLHIRSIDDRLLGPWQKNPDTHQPQHP